MFFSSWFAVYLVVVQCTSAQLTRYPFCSIVRVCRPTSAGWEVFWTLALVTVKSQSDSCRSFITSMQRSSLQPCDGASEVQGLREFRCCLCIVSFRACYKIVSVTGIWHYFRARVSLAHPAYFHIATLPVMPSRFLCQALFCPWGHKDCVQMYIFMDQVILELSGS